SVRGIAASRSGARTSRCPTAPSCMSLCSTGCAKMPVCCAGATNGSTCRGTTAGCCGETRSSPPATWAAAPSASRSRHTRPAATSCSRSTRAGRWRSSMHAHVDAVRKRQIERRLGFARAAAILVAVVQIVFLTSRFPAGYLPAAWALAGGYAAGTLVLFVLARRAPDGALPYVGFVALLFDTSALAAYSIIFAADYGNQTRWTMVLPVCEAALRYGLAGGALLPVVLVPFWWFSEWWRARHLGPPGYSLDRVSFPSALVFVTGVIVGWLVRRLDAEVRENVDRAAEAERLRDALGRRVDVLEAANRCARALGSSLELEPAFGAFIRELRGLVPFDRTAIVLVDGETAQTMATAGRGANDVFPPGSAGPLRGSVLERVLGGELVVRGELDDTEYPEDRRLPVRPERLLARRERAAGAARPARRDRGAEHPRVRGGAADHRRAAAALGAARRLRLAGVARAAEPDGRRDRCRAHAPGALALAHARAPRGVPGPDRRRDE